MAVDDGAVADGASAGAGPSPHAVLDAIKAVLDVGSAEEFPLEVEEAALDAGGWVVGWVGGGLAGRRCLQCGGAPGRLPWG